MLIYWEDCGREAEVLNRQADSELWPRLWNSRVSGASLVTFTCAFQWKEENKTYLQDLDSITRDKN